MEPSNPLQCRPRFAFARWLLFHRIQIWTQSYALSSLTFRYSSLQSVILGAISVFLQFRQPALERSWVLLLVSTWLAPCFVALYCATTCSRCIHISLLESQLCFSLKYWKTLSGVCPFQVMLVLDSAASSVTCLGFWPTLEHQGSLLLWVEIG